MSHILNEDKS